MIDRERFFRALATVLGADKGDGGIGTLGEKLLHAVLKYYLDENPLNHEKKVGGFFADVMNEDGILEIQTRQLYRLGRKLEYMLGEHTVTVVYPIARERRVAWIDPVSGELSPKRKSPKRGRITDVIPELYRIRPYLSHPNFRLRLILLDCDEYKKRSATPRAWRRTERVERIPREPIDDILLSCPNDYRIFLPASLPLRFTSADVARASRIPRSIASTLLLLLTDLGVVRRIAREGRAIVYEMTEAEPNA